MNGSPVHFARRLSFLFLAGAVVWLAGCGGKGVKSNVKGKVLIDGKPAAGSIVFIDADGKKLSAPINGTDGSYNLLNPKKGLNKVAIEGGLSADVPGGKDIKPIVPETKEQKLTEGLTGGTPPHKLYGDVKTSNLEVEVKGEKDQVFDIDLDPKGPKAGGG